MTRDAYNQLLAEVEEAKSAVKKTSLQYRRLKRFYVLEIGEMKTLVSRGETVKSYLPVEIYDVIEAAYLGVGRGGRDRLNMETARKYINVTTEMLNTFLSMCETCQQKKTKKKKGLVSKPILHSELNSRCQIDLIDMQSQSDHEVKFFMVY
jgi:hypothetical protein